MKLVRLTAKRTLQCGLGLWLFSCFAIAALLFFTSIWIPGIERPEAEVLAEVKSLFSMHPGATRAFGWFVGGLLLSMALLITSGILYLFYRIVRSPD